MSGEFSLQSRWRDHGGLTPPLLCMCVCASQKSQFRRRPSATRTRAGGVTPRVEHAKLARGIRIAWPATVTPTKSGGRKPPWLHDRDCNGVHQHAGRQSPATLRKRSCKCAYLATAGLRPPLLALIVRLCIVKVAIPRAAERRANKSEGREPPVVRDRDCNGVRQHAGASLPNICGGAFASASARRTVD